MERKTMTLRYMIKHHRALWKWLAQNPGKRKDDWPGFKFGYHYCVNKCFACDFVVNHKIDDCKFCPLDWSPQEKCTHKDSLYTKWDDNTFPSTFNADAASALAMQIACLPLKKWNYGKYSS